MKRSIIISLLLTTVLYGQAITNFNSGQVSPLFEARQNFTKYQSACRTLENFQVAALGPVMRRPGSKYIATAGAGAPILLSFDYSIDDVYILELGNLYMRFYRNGGQILSGASAYEITTVFTTAELENLRYAQVDNLMYIVNGTDPVQILTRTAHASWTIADVSFDMQPYLPENTTVASTIAATATTGSVTLTAAGSGNTPFDSDHVGASFRINHVAVSAKVSGTLSGDGSSSTLTIGGEFDIVTHGIWTGDVILERSIDAGSNWEPTAAQKHSEDNDNLIFTGEERAIATIYRVTMDNYVSGTATYTLTAHAYIHVGIAKITAVTSSTSATATVTTTLYSTDTTDRWSEATWSAFRGYPKAVAFHQQKLIYGGSESYPTRLWFSGTGEDNYDDFTYGDEDTDAFEIGLQGQNEIQWLMSQNYLLIGTSGSVGRYGQQDQPVTPTTPGFQDETPHGSTNIAAVRTSDAIIYIERGDTKVRELSFTIQFDKYVSPDLTILAEDITSSGIVNMAFQLRPDPVLWCVLADGNMATLTYQREQLIIAWSLITTDGDYESVKVIPGSSGEDEVWTVVKRTIQGTDKRYIEQFQPRDWGTDQDDCWFVDSGLDYDSTATASFSGLSHLAGETASVYADGVIHSQQVVSAAGAVTIDIAAEKVVIGLPYTSKFETLPLILSSENRAKNISISAVYFDLYQTGAMSYGNGANSELIEVDFNPPATLDPRWELYTSTVTYKRFAFPYSSMRKATIYCETSEPMPLTIRAIIPEFRTR